MIVEAAPIVPGKENSRALPVGTLHHSVYEVSDVCLPNTDLCHGVFTDTVFWDHPGDCRECAASGRGVKFVDRLNIRQLAILFNRIKQWQWVPDSWHLFVL